ncbi:uncharacterized protein LOC119268042 isoform X2 [Triticum dicoccoides]|uniref:uncharacterized protein LOC119268042 isoform X2 n=1 Tax=Triticum dicoccoides TaxID=85692 RepID=UPI00188F14D0|nr:uncharacterized protein LOC119268042 isoform X2 [Triticum dicoccoides]
MGDVSVVQQEEQLGEGQGGVGHCCGGMAWTLVNLTHFVITYHFFHWNRGTPFADDQGMYNRLTWWDQMDNNKQLRKAMFICSHQVNLLYNTKQISCCGSAAVLHQLFCGSCNQGGFWQDRTLPLLLLLPPVVVDWSMHGG